MHLQFVIASMLLLLAAAAEENSCSLPFCSSCTNNGPQCLECATDKVLNNDKTKCLDCPENCVKCMNDDKCETCSDSYYKTTDDTCEKCMDNCDTCTDDSSCDQCTAGFSFSEEDKECQGCAKGEYKEASGSCASCPTHATDCALVGETVRVTSCKETYVVNVDTADATKSGTKCLTCPKTCTQCNGEVKTGTNAKCTACQAQLYLVDDECTGCGGDDSGNDAKCVDCTVEGKCSKCKEGFMADDEGVCQACAAKCLACKLDDEAVRECSTCDTKYGVNGGKTCDSCPSNCDACSMNSGVMDCTTCKAGFEENTDGVCNSCPANCKTCDWHVTSASHYDCDTCVDGYVARKKVGVQFVCNKCPDHCTECTYHNNAIADDDDLEFVCSTCEEGYFLEIKADNEKLCRPLPANCVSLVTATPAATDDDVVCHECDSGYAIDDDRCTIECMENCKTCTTEDDCSVCKDGSSDLNADANGALATLPSCPSCTESTNGISYCQTCTFTTVDGTTDTTIEDTMCTLCMDGYCAEGSSSDITKCHQCPSNCIACTFTDDKALCDTCKPGYAKAYGDTNPTGTCKKCLSKCDLCTGSVDGIKCNAGECQDRTALDGEGLCQDCPEHCAVCAFSDDTLSCTTCDGGYGKDNNGECLDCPANCKVCSPDDDGEMVCGTCSTTYGPNEDDCAACSANCDECTYDKGTMKCGKCASKYAKVSVGCENCPTNCDECSSATKCNNGKCTAGYAKDASGACVLCSSLTFEKCILCTDHPGSNSNDTSECTKCQSGYVLKDGITKGKGAECKDVSSLECGAKPIADLPPQCATDSCTGGTYLDDDFVCVRKCYVCGDLSTNDFVAPVDCTTSNDTAVECKSGVCYGEQKSENDKVTGVMMGCLTDATQCTDDMKDATQLCKDTPSADACKRCCDDKNMCNDWPGTSWSGAGHITASVLLIAVFLITNIF